MATQSHGKICRLRQVLFLSGWRCWSICTGMFLHNTSTYGGSLDDCIIWHVPHFLIYLSYLHRVWCTYENNTYRMLFSSCQLWIGKDIIIWHINTQNEIDYILFFLNILKLSDNLLIFNSLFSPFELSCSSLVWKRNECNCLSRECRKNVSFKVLTTNND